MTAWSLGLELWTLATILLATFLAQAAFAAPCSENLDLTVTNASTLSNLYSSLEEANADCVVIRVDWVGNVDIEKTINVPTGVELQIHGKYEQLDGDSNDDSSTTASPPVLRASVRDRLFVVNENGNLSISEMTLQNGFGGPDGGGGILAFGDSNVMCNNCSWESLSAEGAGGAISTTGTGASFTLSGTNSFSNCSALTRGGAIKLDTVTLSVEGSVLFENCTAKREGGGLYIEDMSLFRVGQGSSVSFLNCTAGSVDGDNGGGLCSYESIITIGANAMVSFENNSVPVDGNGGGFFGKNSYVTVSEGASLSFVNNHVLDDGGGMYLEGVDDDDFEGDIDQIQCFIMAKGANANFSGNSGGDSIGFGGAVQFSTGCNVDIAGDVHFEHNVGVRAGAIYFVDSKAVFSGKATFVNNTAERWGGAVMVVDSDVEFNGSVIFQNNSAGRSGGALYLESASLAIAPGSSEDVEMLWEGNSAGYDGGVFSVDDGTARVEGGFARYNSASQRGGVAFATGESSFSWTGGESWGNSAAAGGSLYMSNSKVNLTDVRLVGDRTPSGATVFLAGSDALMVNTRVVAPDDLSGDFALHVDAHSFLKAFSCSFELWTGDHNLVMSEGSIVLDACDFRNSSITSLVHAEEPATIRNAILGDKNYASTGYNASAVFGSDTNTCSTLSDAYACISNGYDKACVDAAYGMGVLCAEYIAAATGDTISLGGGGSPVELVTTSVPSVANDVYYPDLVEEELILRYSSASSESSDRSSGSQSSSEGEGVVETATGAVLWELRSMNGSEYGGTPTNKGIFNDVISVDNFSWTAMPVSGVLMKGQELTISLVGTPPPAQDPQRPSAMYNGEVFATFHVLSRTADTGSTNVSSAADVNATYYYCPAEEYWDGVECVSCVELMSGTEDGEGSLECNMPGVTLETLPLAPGYWRGDVNNTIIQSCLLADACKGGRGDVSLTDSISTDNYMEDTRYCETGYKGPYCAVCREGFRHLSGYECVDCQSELGTAARAALWLAVALTPILLISLMLFLFGGTRSFKQLRKKIGSACGRSEPAGVTQWSTGEEPQTEAVVRGGDDREEGRVSRSRGLGARVLRAVPFQQLKILIVVWQILTQSSSLAEIPYPSSYKRFLRTLDVFNFDLSWFMSSMCIVGKIDFYQKLLIVTLVPILMLGLLGLSYAGAMRWHQGTSRAAIESLQEAKVRHASTALLVLFLVFSSVSTSIFSTFSCKYVEDLGVRLLRADYSISCDDREHLFYQIYAAVMILVYPVGIPVMFAYLLLVRRDKINPPDVTGAVRVPLKARVRALTKGRGFENPSVRVAAIDFSVSSFVAPSQGSRDEGGATRSGMQRPWTPRGLVPSDGVGGGEGGGDKDGHRKEVLRKRAEDLDLQPTKFLWEPYEPSNFYFETVECGRRCLLTGALVFVLPNTAGQMAGASIFAFVAILVFEMIRPHLLSTDAWMYRIGCIVIFFSNFLGLMAKTDVSGEDGQSQELFGVLLICVHVTMILAIIAQSYITMQAASESRDDLVEGLLPEESSARGDNALNSMSGTKHATPRMTFSPKHYCASRGGNAGTGERFILPRSSGEDRTWNCVDPEMKDSGPGHQFDHIGSCVMQGALPSHLTRPMNDSRPGQETMDVLPSQGAIGRQHNSAGGRYSSANRDFYAFQGTNDREVGPRGSFLHGRPMSQFATAPGARGALSSTHEFSHEGDIGKSDGGFWRGSGDVSQAESASPPGDLRDSASVRPTFDKGVYSCTSRRGLLHRLKSTSGSDMGPAAPIAPLGTSRDGPDKSEWDTRKLPLR